MLMEVAESPKEYRRPVIAAWLGWLMDGYVTIAYLIQLGVIAPLFFPGKLFDLYFFYFVINGAARALGSFVLGNFIGDRIGRRRMIVITVVLFSISSFSIGLLPTYYHVGIMATISIGILLFFMGLFAGAEYGGGAALSMENVPKEKRNLIGAFVQSGFGVGYAILSLVYALLTSLLRSSYSIYGWRILFFTTAIIGLIALVVRKYSSESPVFQEYVKKEKVEKWPLLRLFRDRWRAVIATITIAGSLLFLNSITLSLYPTILETVDFFGKSISGVALFFINAISIGGVILGGFIAGRSLKRLSFMLIYTLMFLVVSAAIVSFVFRNNLLLVSAAFSAQAFFEAMIFSTLPAFLTEVFSKRFRTTAVGSVYNIGSMIGSIGIFVVPYYAGIYGWSTVWSIAVVIFSLILIAGVSLSIGSYSREIKSGDLIVD